jgi:hypothetical protein
VAIGKAYRYHYSGTIFSNLAVFPLVSGIGFEHSIGLFGSYDHWALGDITNPLVNRKEITWLRMNISRTHTLIYSMCPIFPTFLYTTVCIDS